VKRKPSRERPVFAYRSQFGGRLRFISVMLWGNLDRGPLRADTAPSHATPVGPLPRPFEASKAAIRNGCFTSTPVVQGKRISQ
jgi:hypothetical protein